MFVEGFDLYIDDRGLVHDKTCGCVGKFSDEMVGVKKMTYSLTPHKKCRAFIYIRMIAGSKNVEKYFRWFKFYGADTVALRKLALEKKAKCQLRDNKMYIDTGNDRWIIETGVSKNEQRGMLYHCNYKKVGSERSFNSSAYHKQYPYTKNVVALISAIADHEHNRDNEPETTDE